MQLLKKTILASICVVLLPVESFAQTPEIQPADVSQSDIISSWASNNEEVLESAFEDYSLSWGSYILSLKHETKEATRFSDLFHAFTADFTNRYGMRPQQASIELLQKYYAQRKNDYGGELLLPTMAVWHNRPMSSIVPIPDQLDSYWGNPNQAGDTYDFMAQIDREDTLYFMGSHMGAFFGHPTKRKTLENFWKKWMKRADSSAAKQDIEALKRVMLAEILSHDPEYAVQELASKKVDLWPALYVSPATVEEQARVREIVTSYCLKDAPTESCIKFAEYADHFEYSNDLVKQIRDNLSKTKTNYGYTDEVYNTANVYWVADPDLLWPYDPWYGWYYQSGVRFYIYWNRPFISPWYWQYWYWYRPPVIGRPGHHRPPSLHHGHRPPAVRPGHGGGHHPGGKPGGHRPGGNGHRPGNPGGNGHNPGHNPGGHGGSGSGHNPGGNGGNGHNPGHNPGGNGGSGHNPGGNGGNGHNPGHNPGGNGGHNPGGNGGNGHNPGHNPGGNGGHNPGGNGDNPGHNPGGNGNNPGGHGGNPRQPDGIINDRVRPEITREDIKGTPRSAEIREGRAEHFNSGNGSNFGHRHATGSTGGNTTPSTTTPSRPSSPSSFGGNSRPSTTSPSRPSSPSSFGGNSRPSTTSPSRPSSHNSFGGGSHPSVTAPSRSASGHSNTSPSRPSSGSFSGGSSRPSSGGSFGGSSRSSGGFSGGAHGGSSSGSHGSHQGGGGHRH